MIEVIIRHKGSKAELGRIEIENVGGTEDEGDYSIRFGVERIAAVGVHRRGIFAFPRRKYNVLALLRQALSTLELDELELDSGDLDMNNTSTGNILNRGL